ncbi:MAG TPA: hypothetical protein PLI07_13625, partial [Candidatus Hydrogenedentes bacterium]|nr:hypothetical protein [Candidatus Hydrogenedentota bacterium]
NADTTIAFFRFIAFSISAIHRHSQSNSAQRPAAAFMSIEYTPFLSGFTFSRQVPAKAGESNVR